MDSLVCTVDNCRVFNLPRLIETSLSGSANTKRLMDKAGRRLLRAQAEYAVGIGTAARSLAALDRVVFNERRIPLESLLHALSIDFQATNLTEAWTMMQVYQGLYARGAVSADRLRAVNNYQCGHYNDGEFIRRLLLDSADEETVYLYHQALMRLCCQAKMKVSCPDSLNAALGARTGATPDGRRAGAPFL